MPAAELRRVLQQVATPATFDEYVAESKPARAASAELHAAKSKAMQAHNASLAPKQEVDRTTAQRDRWREQHPIRSKLHDWGVLKGGPLTEFAKKLTTQEAEKKAADERAAHARQVEQGARAKLEKITTDPQTLAELRKQFERDNARFREVSAIYTRREAMERDVAKTVDKFVDAAELHARGKLPNVDSRTAEDLRRFNDAQRTNGEKKATEQLHNALVADPQKHEAVKQSLAPHTKEIDRSAGRGR